MANIFQPDVNFNIQPESPVAPAQPAPSALGAVANVGSQINSLVQAEMKRSGTSGGRSGGNLATFARDMEEVEQIRASKGEIAGVMAENRVLSKFATAGVDLDNSFGNTYTAVTGRGWDFAGVDWETQVDQNLRKNPEYALRYSVAASVNPGSDPEEVHNIVRQELSEVQFYRQEVEKSKLEAGYKWTAKTNEAYDAVIDDFWGKSIQANVASSNDLTPQGITELELNWNKVKVGLTKPQNVSDEAYSATAAKIKAIDGFIGTLKEADANTLKMVKSRLGATVANLMVSKVTTPTDAIVVMAAIENPLDFMKSYAHSEPFQKAMESILKFTKGDGNKLKRETWNLTNLTAEDKAAGLDAGRALAGGLPGDMDKNAKNYAQGANLLADLLKEGGEDYLSTSYLSKTFGPRSNWWANYQKLRQINPADAAEVGAKTTEALKMEAFRQQTVLSSIENNMTGAKWDGKGYVLSFPEGSFRDEGTLAIFQRNLDEAYGGNLIEAAKDNYKRMHLMNDRNTLEVKESGGLWPLKRAAERREALAIIGDLQSKLSENDEDFRFFNYLGVGNEQVQETQPPIPRRRGREPRPELEELGFRNLRPIEEVERDIDNAIRNNDLEALKALATEQRQLIQGILSGDPDIRVEEIKGILGMGGFKRSEGPSVGERAFRNVFGQQSPPQITDPNFPGIIGLGGFPDTGTTEEEKERLDLGIGRDPRTGEPIDLSDEIPAERTEPGGGALSLPSLISPAAAATLDDTSSIPELPEDQIVDTTTRSMPGTPIQMPLLYRQVRDYVSEGEGTSWEQAVANGYDSPYDVPLGYGKFDPKGFNKPISEMTFAELDKYQIGLIKNSKGKLKDVDPQYGSSAVGRYQIIRKTLKSLKRKLGLSDDDVFSPEVQDKMFMILAEYRGLEKFQRGEITRGQFQNRLAKEWASVAKTDGTSFYGQPTSGAQFSSSTTPNDPVPIPRPRPGNDANTGIVVPRPRPGNDAGFAEDQIVDTITRSMPDTTPAEVKEAIDHLQGAKTLDEIRALGAKQRALMQMILNFEYVPDVKEKRNERNERNEKMNFGIGRDPRTFIPIDLADEIPSKKE